MKITGKKILVTGPAGQIAEPICRTLAEANQICGIARFSEPGSRERVEAIGVTTREVDLATGAFGDLPNDFDYLLHFWRPLSRSERTTTWLCPSTAKVPRC
jgi:nucleoside-diphosphate-sugar epimerase